jgi:CheY-like chemotaxis protein
MGKDMTPRPTRVLCVEDDLFQQQLLDHHLRAIPELACATTFEATEEGAWGAFSRQPPDVVLVDYQLNQGDGLSLIRRLRAVDAFVPIIAVSGVAPTEVADELIRSGAEDYLDKRILGSSSLARSIRATLRRADAFRKQQAGPDASREALAKRVRDLFEFLTRLGGDALLGHVEAIVTAARRVRELEHVTAAFERVCQESVMSPDVARRTLQPYLFEVIAAIWAKAGAND